jgi:hypothetical protein
MNLKVYLTERGGYFTNLNVKVPCQYKKKCDYCKEKHWFICDCCDRSVPWCFGGDDDGGDELCNDCWYQATQLDWVEEAAA